MMELASMLAGEPFSDSPRSVCPVVAAFLRHYNDRVDDSRRQDLYGFAAAAVGTREKESLRWRAQLCARLGEAYGASLKRHRRLMSRWRPEWHAESAAKALAEDASHHRVALLTLDLLVGEDDPRSKTAPPVVAHQRHQPVDEATVDC